MTSSRISFRLVTCSYHTRAISMGITKAESRTLIDAAHHAKGRLCRMRVGAPAALA